MKECPMCGFNYEDAVNMKMPLTGDPLPKGGYPPEVKTLDDVVRYCAKYWHGLFVKEVKRLSVNDLIRGYVSVSIFLPQAIKTKEDSPVSFQKTKFIKVPFTEFLVHDSDIRLPGYKEKRFNIRKGFLNGILFYYIEDYNYWNNQIRVDEDD